MYKRQILSCLILRFPSLTSSKDPAKIPAWPVLFRSLEDLKFTGINSEIFLDSKKNLGKQLTYANKRECPVAVICGENEFKENTVTLKNLLGIKGDDNQKTVKKENLVNEIKKLIWKNP